MRNTQVLLKSRWLSRSGSREVRGNRFLALKLLLGLLGFVQVALAEGDKDSCVVKLSLESFRAMALHNSPLVSEIDGDYANQLATAFATEVLANPELAANQTFTSMDLNGDNDPQAEISIGQALRLSDFGSRSRVAALIRKVGNTDKLAKILEFNTKLTLQFRALLSLQNAAELLTVAEARAAKGVAMVKDGVKKGLLSSGDEHLFTGEKYHIQAQLLGLASQKYALQSELAESIGATCSIIALTEAKLPPLPAEETLIEIARTNEVSATSRLKVLADLANEQTELANLERYPELTPKLVYQHTNDGGDFLGAGFSIPLPFWNRNQGVVISSKGQQQQADAKYNFYRSGGLAAQVRALVKASINAEAQSNLFTTKVIPSFSAALASQENLYAAGKSNVLQVWQTFQVLNEAQANALQLQLQASSIRMRLALLIGEDV